MNTSHTLRSLAALMLFASLVISSTVGSAQSVEKTSAQAAGQAAPARLIDINSADEAELESLPGVGPSRARAIIETRKTMNGFKRVEDLMRVKGIGRKTFRDLQLLVTVGAAPKTAGTTAKPAKP